MPRCLVLFVKTAYAEWRETTMNANHKNITKYWDSLEGYAGDDLKQEQFKTFLICELSGDVDELQFKLAIERAKIDMRSKTYRTGEKVK
jgi:hypothetical protein